MQGFFFVFFILEKNRLTKAFHMILPNKNHISLYGIVSWSKILLQMILRVCDLSRKQWESYTRNHALSGDL